MSTSTKLLLESFTTASCEKQPRRRGLPNAAILHEEAM